MESQTGKCFMSDSAGPIEKLNDNLQTLNVTLEKYMAVQEVREQWVDERIGRKVEEGFVADQLKDHVKECPARSKKTSVSPPQYEGKMNAFFNALGPFLLKWGLPILGALGVGYGASAQYNVEQINPPAQITPADKGE